MTENKAKAWVKNKENQKSVIRRLFEEYPPHKNKLAFFMAGIPGAGKTEFANNTINSISPKLVPIEHDKLVEYMESIYLIRYIVNRPETRLSQLQKRNRRGKSKISKFILAGSAGFVSLLATPKLHF